MTDILAGVAATTTSKGRRWTVAATPATSKAADTSRRRRRRRRTNPADSTYASGHAGRFHRAAGLFHHGRGQPIHKKHHEQNQAHEETHDHPPTGGIPLLPTLPAPPFAYRRRLAVGTFVRMRAGALRRVRFHSEEKTRKKKAKRGACWVSFIPFRSRRKKIHASRIKRTFVDAHTHTHTHKQHANKKKKKNKKQWILLGPIHFFC